MPKKKKKPRFKIPKKLDKIPVDGLPIWKLPQHYERAYRDTLLAISRYVEHALCNDINFLFPKSYDYLQEALKPGLELAQAIALQDNKRIKKLMTRVDRDGEIVISPAMEALVREEKEDDEEDYYEY